YAGDTGEASGCAVLDCKGRKIPKRVQHHREDEDAGGATQDVEHGGGEEGQPDLLPRRGEVLTEEEVLKMHGREHGRADEPHPDLAELAAQGDDEEAAHEQLLGESHEQEHTRRRKEGAIVGTPVDAGKHEYDGHEHERRNEDRPADAMLAIEDRGAPPAEEGR